MQMTWTKQHSQNAVAAKRRVRIQRLSALAVPLPGTVPKPRRFVPDFTITIRSRSGERVRITATRYGRQLITGDGIKSARSLCRGIEMLLRWLCRESFCVHAT